MCTFLPIHSTYICPMRVKACKWVEMRLLKIQIPNKTLAAALRSPTVICLAPRWMPCPMADGSCLIELLSTSLPSSATKNGVVTH